MDPRDKKSLEIKKRRKQELLDKAYTEVVEKQLKRLQEAKKHQVAEEDEERHKLELGKAREAALSKKGSKLSARHEELARNTGLSGQFSHVHAIIC